MQKISLELLETMCGADLSNRELDFILYVARFQDDSGKVQGIYYRDICKELQISYQTYYNCIRSLSRKGIIEAKKASYFDWDIEFINNDFTGKENFGRGYVSLHRKMVRSKEFKELTAKAKLMALWLMREWLIYKKKSGADSYRISKENFINKFQNLLGIEPRTARAYLGMLEPFLSIYLEDGRLYYLTFKTEAIQEISRYEVDELRHHVLDVSCRRNRIKERENEEITSVVEVLSQYHHDIKKDGLNLLNLPGIIEQSLAKINFGIKNKYKWKRRLNPALIHKLIRESLYGPKQTEPAVQN